MMQAFVDYVTKVRRPKGLRDARPGFVAVGERGHETKQPALLFKGRVTKRDYENIKREWAEAHPDE